MDDPSPRRSWRLLAALALVGLVVGAVLTVVQPRVWRATAQVLVAPAAADVVPAADRSDVVRSARRLAALVHDPAVVDVVASQFAGRPSVGVIERAVTASVGSLPVVTVQVDLPDAGQADEVATAFAARLAAAAGGSVRASVTADRTVPDPPLARDLWPPLGALVGVLSGAVVLAVARRRRAVVRSLWALDGAAGAPAATLGGTDGPLDLVRLLAGRRLVAVGAPTSAGDSSHAALQLARALARAGRTVALVDGDLRRGDLQRSLGLPAGPGLADALTGRVNVLDTVQSSGLDEPFAVIGAGTIPARPAALLRSPRAASVLGLLQEETDVVVVRLPPVLEGSEALMLGADSQAVVLVARVGRTARREVEAAAAALTAIGASLGAALLLEPDGRPTVERARALLRAAGARVSAIARAAVGDGLLPLARRLARRRPPGRLRDRTRPAPPTPAARAGVLAAAGAPGVQQVLWDATPWEPEAPAAPVPAASAAPVERWWPSIEQVAAAGPRRRVRVRVRLRRSWHALRAHLVAWTVLGRRHRLPRGWARGAESQAGTETLILVARVQKPGPVREERVVPVASRRISA